MGLCDKRHFLLTICILQILTTSERQVFDFLGYMWVPILVNFFNIIFVILGFFGAFQYRPKYIITYCVWNVVWLTWNAFLICFYLGIGGLDKNSDLLNFGTGSFSWWLINGPGCKEVTNNSVADQPDVYRPIRPDRVVGCFLEYEVIEVIHSSIQCFLAVLSIIGGICLSRVFLEEDDSSQIRKKKKKKQPRPLYSIEYSRPEPSTLHRSQQQHHQLHHQQQQQQQQQLHQQDDNVSPKPMTPRRVKRRSVISRDGTHRRSGQRLRSSTASRQSARRKNPVNRIMDQQESLYANSPAIIGGLTNQNVSSLSQGALNYDRISGHWGDRERNASHPSIPSWQLDAMAMMSASSPNIWGHEAAAVAAAAAYVAGSQPGGLLGPANWESASSTRQLVPDGWPATPTEAPQPQPQQQAAMLPAAGPPVSSSSPMQWQGQSNPSFQQTSSQSLNGEDLEELYGNRPASARSSYSNYHGVRATPQVPSRSDIVRQSQRQFVLSGPPAYQDTVI